MSASKAWGFRAAVLITTLCTVQIRADDSMRTISDCVADGFDPLQLPCRFCDKLSQQPPFNGVAAFRGDCRDCCRPDDLERGPFARAELQISRAMSSRWGGVNEFLEKEANGFPGLSVVDTPVSEPRIVLSEGKDAARATLYVGAWKTEHIRELLHTFVTSTASASSSEGTNSAAAAAAATSSSASSSTKDGKGGDGKKKSKKRSERKKSSKTA